jgi:hypothetical protein
VGDDTVGEFVSATSRPRPGRRRRKPVNGHDPEAIHLAAETLQEMIG